MKNGNKVDLQELLSSGSCSPDNFSAEFLLLLAELHKMVDEWNVDEPLRSKVIKHLIKAGNIVLDAEEPSWTVTASITLAEIEATVE